MLPADVEDEVEGEPGNAVSVTGHDLADLAAHDGVQKGKELGPLPVDPAPDLLDELVLWSGFLEALCFPLEILCLFSTRDPGIADVAPVAAAILRLVSFISFDSEHAFDVSDAVEPLPCP